MNNDFLETVLKKMYEMEREIFTMSVEELTLCYGTVGTGFWFNQFFNHLPLDKELTNG